MARPLPGRAKSEAIANIIAEEAAAKKALDAAKLARSQARDAYAEAEEQYDQVAQMNERKIREVTERRIALTSPFTQEDDETDDDNSESSDAIEPQQQQPPKPPAAPAPPAFAIDTSSLAQFHPTNPKNLTYIPWAPNIVYLKTAGQYVEIACCHCEGNCAPDGTLWLGSGPLHEHLQKVHKHPSANFETTVKLCKLRIVPKLEVEWILTTRAKGMPYVEQVPAETEDRTIARPTDLASRTSFSFATKSANYISHTSCVVRHPNGDWFVLACPHCGGNADEYGETYLRGVQGFYHHLTMDHGDHMPQVVETVIARCWVCKLTRVEYSRIDTYRGIEPAKLLEYYPISFEKVNSGQQQLASSDDEDADHEMDDVDFTLKAPRTTRPSGQAARWRNSLSPTTGEGSKSKLRVLSHVGLGSNDDETDDEEDDDDLD